jgi:hypothetical protein
MKSKAEPDPEDLAPPYLPGEGSRKLAIVGQLN